MRLALLRYVAIAELCPRPIMATSIVLHLAEAVHSVAVSPVVVNCCQFALTNEEILSDRPRIDTPARQQPATK